MFYLTTHSTHFIYDYMASDIWLRTILIVRKEREREMFYLMMHSTHFIYSYMASDIWLRTILIVREREMFYLTTQSTHYIYGYMASDIWLRTILIVREETRCHIYCIKVLGSGKCIYVSIYFQVSDTPTHGHSLWHGQ